MSEQKIHLSLGDLLVMLDSVKRGLPVTNFAGVYSRETRQGVFERVHNQIAYISMTIAVETEEDEQETGQSTQEDIL